MYAAKTISWSASSRVQERPDQLPGPQEGPREPAQVVPRGDREQGRQPVDPGRRRGWSAGKQIAWTPTCCRRSWWSSASTRCSTPSRSTTRCSADLRRRRARRAQTAVDPAGRRRDQVAGDGRRAWQGFRVDVEGTRPGPGSSSITASTAATSSPSRSSPRRAQVRPWQTTLRNVQRSMRTCRRRRPVEAYHLEVLPAPDGLERGGRPRLPDCTGVPDRVGIDGGEVAAAGGHEGHGPREDERARGVEQHQPRRSAFAMQSEEDGQARRQVPGDRGRVVPIGFTTTGGQKNPEPVVYEIRA